MSASANATPTPVTPSIPRTTATTPPAPPTAAAPVATPAAPKPKPLAQRINWSMAMRVGVVAALVLALVGYALKVTYESVIQGGVVSSGDHYRVELKQMSNFEMDQSVGTVADVPERFRNLDGKKVVLEGEVAPGGSSAGDTVKRFSLCYSVAKCCFGGPMKVQHFVACSAGGRPMPNFDGAGPVRVFGTLHIKVYKTDVGTIDSIFQMDVERIERVS
jgi:hypothetical protein